MKQIVAKLTKRLVIPLIGLVTLLSACILLVSVPAVWETLYDSVMKERLRPKMLEDAHSISQAFWNDNTYTEVNKSLHYNLLGSKEILHFADVRAIIHFFFYPLSIGLIILTTWRFALKRNISWGYSLLQLTAIGGTLAVWALYNWRHMFRTLHWWIFQDDSWILPKGCYTLYLYPYAVWQWVSAIVLGGVLLSLLALFTGQKLLSKRATA